VRALGVMMAVIGATFLVAAAGAAAAVLLVPLPEQIQVGPAAVDPSSILAILSLLWGASGSVTTAAGIRIRHTHRPSARARLRSDGRAPRHAARRPVLGAQTVRNRPVSTRSG